MYIINHVVLMRSILIENVAYVYSWKNNFIDFWTLFVSLIRLVFISNFFLRRRTPAGSALSSEKKM